MNHAKPTSLLRRKRRESRPKKRGIDVHASFFGKTTRNGKRKLIQRS